MKRKIGIGTIALLLGVITIFLSISFTHNGICYGDKLVEFFGLKSWSNGTSGTHYTLLYLIPFFALSIFIGYKFKDDWGAKIGRRISILILAMILISIPFMAISISSYKDGDSKTSQADYLFSKRNQYIGDNTATSKLLEALEVSKLGNYTIELKTDEKPYALKINFSKYTVDPSSQEYQRKMRIYSIILLALIENLDEVNYYDPTCSCIDEMATVSVNELNEIYEDIKEYGKPADNLQSLLIAIDYYEKNKEKLTLKDLSYEGLVFRIEAGNKECVPVMLAVYENGDYKLYNAFKALKDGEIGNSMLSYSEPTIVGTSDYDILKIIENSVDASWKSFDMSNLPEYEIYSGKGGIYTTDKNNQYLNEYLKSINIDLNTCAEKDYIK